MEWRCATSMSLAICLEHESNFWFEIISNPHVLLGRSQELMETSSFRVISGIRLSDWCSRCWRWLIRGILAEKVKSNCVMCMHKTVSHSSSIWNLFLGKKETRKQLFSYCTQRDLEFHPSFHFLESISVSQNLKLKWCSSSFETKQPRGTVILNSAFQVLRDYTTWKCCRCLSKSETTPEDDYAARQFFNDWITTRSWKRFITSFFITSASTILLDHILAFISYYVHDVIFRSLLHYIRLFIESLFSFCL